MRSPGDEKEGNEIFMSLVSGQVAKQDLKWRHSSLIYVEDRFRKVDWEEGSLNI